MIQSGLRSLFLGEPAQTRKAVVFVLTWDADFHLVHEKSRAPVHVVMTQFDPLNLEQQQQQQQQQCFSMIDFIIFIFYIYFLVCGGGGSRFILNVCLTNQQSFFGSVRQLDNGCIFLGIWGSQPCGSLQPTKPKPQIGFIHSSAPPQNNQNNKHKQQTANTNNKHKQ